MKPHLIHVIVFTLSFLQSATSNVSAHPASAIVVDGKGQVFFVYSGHGVMKIGFDGQLAAIHSSRGGHWMCLDREGAFTRTQPKYFERITPDGVKPAILFADGGAPLVVNHDGNLYYGSWATREDPFAPGALTVTRMSADGKCEAFAPTLAKTLADMNEGVTGLAAGPDGVIYVASWSAILKVKIDGTVSTLAKGITLADCDWDPPDHDRSNHKPCFRGLDVDSDGAVYAAATSCRRVAKITPAGEVSIVLKSEAPWSPTTVALHDGAIYVLEYTNANGGHDEPGGWAPRVRRIGRDGRITVLADLSNPKPQPGGR